MALVPVTPVGHGAVVVTLTSTSGPYDHMSVSVPALVVILPGLVSSFSTHGGTVVPSIVVGFC